jgi:4-amino-4-deoxy-L-arabinose transferase-like glycosyltransferase
MPPRDGTASAVPFLFPALLAAITAVALLRVAATWRVFAQTFDEPAHVACGVEIATTGRYTLEPQHPPLSRIFIGLGARLAGATLPPRGTVWQRGNAILYARDYLTTLAAARAGVLPFLAIIIATTAFWARRLYDEWTALLAAFFVSTTPQLLAHAGLATTDVAVAAMVLVALFAVSLWLDHPTVGRAVLFGLASGLAVAAKFSALLFLPAGVVALVLAVRARPRRWLPLPESRRHIVLVGAAFALALWAAYLFSPDAPARIVEGLRVAIAHEQGGHPAYLLGRNSQTGFWYFFVVAFAVKIPLAMIALALAAPILSRRVSEPLAVILAFFLVTMPVNVAIGFRHILPIVPFAAMLAAEGAMWLVRRRWRVAAALLIAWHLVSTTLTHPDYLAYFNELAVAQPDYFLVDSDLDWGQDALRLAAAADAPLTVAYFGTADLRRHLRVPFRYLRPNEQPHGWIAVSETVLRKGKPPGRFAFLDGVPYTRIGKSIRLYYRR